jgi:hypothetical protein
MVHTIVPELLAHWLQLVILLQASEVQVPLTTVYSELTQVLQIELEVLQEIQLGSLQITHNPDEGLTVNETLRHCPQIRSPLHATQLGSLQRKH